MATWYIAYGSEIKSLKDWGIDSMLLERANFSTEFLRFSMPVASIYSAPVFAEDQSIKLYRDAVCWFVGRIFEAPSEATHEERQHFVAVNMWSDLEETIYQQQYVVYNPAATAKLGSWSSKVVLGQNQFGTKITATEQIRLIANFGNAFGGLGAFTSAFIPTWAVPPLETVRDISCAEAIRRMASYAPDAVGWVDYSSGSPALYITQRSGLSTVNLDLASNTKIEGVSSLRKLSALVPRGVVITYITSEQVGDGPVITRETRDTAGATTGRRVIFATVELAEDETVPTGLASQYYNALSTVQYAGQLTLHEEEVTGTVRPGMRINLLNGRADWATMYATVQRSTENILTGVTSIEIGHADYLGLEEFADMMRRWRERNGAGLFPKKQHNGTAGTDGSAGTDPTGGSIDNDPDAGGAGGASGTPNDSGGTSALLQTIDLVYCRQSDGTARIARVVGTDAGSAP